MWPFKKKQELSLVKNETVIQEEQFVFSTIDVSKKVNNEYCIFTVNLKSGKKFKSKLKSIEIPYQRRIFIDTGEFVYQWTPNCKILYTHEYQGGKLQSRQLGHDSHNYVFTTLDGKSVQLPIDQVNSIIFDEIQTEEVKVIDSILVKNKKIENTTNG